MRWTMVLAVALLLGSGSQAAEKKIKDHGIVAPANLPVTYMRPAVDHVVIYAFWRGFGPKGGDRVTIWRHGVLVRETTEYIGSKRPFDPPSETNFSNIATGASFHGSLRGPGERSGFTIWRQTETTRGQHRYELVKTEDERTIAGQRCTMWRADPLGEPGAVFTGLARRACVATDGVVLYDAWLYRDGKVAEERTATRVQRRRVAPAEVLPPKEAMDWAAWFARTRTLEPKPTGRPLNYDLRLKQTGDWSESVDRQRQRAADGWELREEWAGAKRQRFYLYHSSGALALSADVTSLSMHFSPDPNQLSWDSGTAPLDKKPEKILGEECVWFNTTVHVFDYYRLECRSNDGIPLRIEEGGRGGDGPSNVAVAITRGKTTLRDMIPPAGMFRWTNWGWPELDRRQSGTP